jgi:hypothetical protein
MSAEPTVACDGPFVCPYPKTWDHKAGDRWTCPGCGARYTLSRPKPPRFWRNWDAPHGHWLLIFRDRTARY